MSRALVVLNSRHKRRQAAELMMRAPLGTRVEIKGARRSLPQNDKLWAMLTDVAAQAEWAGKKRTPDQWKDLFTAAYRTANNGLEVVPGLEGGFMLLGLRTSDMSKEELGELLEYIEAWGAQNGVEFTARDEASGNAPSAAA